MKQTLQNDYLGGDAESYPQELTKAYELLLHWRSGPDNRRDRTADDGLISSLAFLQATGGQQKQPRQYTSHKATKKPPQNTKTKQGGANKNHTPIHTQDKRRPTCWECGKQGHLARECTEGKATHLLIDGKEGGYETAEEFAFVTTARSYREIEDMILTDIFEGEGEPAPLDEMFSSSDETEDLLLPGPTYDLTHIPQSYRLQRSPFATSHVRFTDDPNDDEGWTIDNDRPTFSFFSVEPRPPTPPIRAFGLIPTDAGADEVLLAHHNSPPETIVFEPPLPQGLNMASQFPAADPYDDLGGEYVREDWSAPYSDMEMSDYSPQDINSVPELVSEPGPTERERLLAGRGDESVSSTSSEDPDDPDDDSTLTSVSSGFDYTVNLLISGTDLEIQSGSDTETASTTTNTTPAEDPPPQATTATSANTPPSPPTTEDTEEERSPERTEHGLRLPLREEEIPEDRIPGYCVVCGDMHLY